MRREAADDWGQPIMVAGNGQGIYYPLPTMIRTTHFLQYPQIWDKTIKMWLLVEK